MTYYHGRSKARPYYGNHIYITNSLEYASLYASEGVVYEVEVLCNMSTIFSLRNLKDVELLKNTLPNHIVNKLNLDEEIDWSEMSALYMDPFDSMEEWLKSLGYKGMKLKERSGIDSIYIFDQEDISLGQKVSG